MDDKIKALSAPIGTTLDRCIDLNQDEFLYATGELSRLLRDIGLAAKILGREINRAGLAGLGGLAGSENVQGEEQKMLDVVGHIRFVRALKMGGQVCCIVSEEKEELVLTDKNDAKYVITAAAPCPESLHKWYSDLGIDLLELYGMTENGGLCTIMRKTEKKMGTVGKTYPGAEIQIDKETNEVLMKADWIMPGYYKDPEKTAEVIKDGYLHTGDMGSIDDEGFLSITGRVKDTFKTAKGEYVVPGPIEWGFTLNTNVEQICVIGRNLAQPVAMIVLSELGLNLDRSEAENSIQESVAQINKSVTRHERVAKSIIMKEAWSTENGILTPTLKVKRNVLEERYQEKLENWYDKEESIIWE